MARRISKAALKRAAEMLPTSNRVLQNLVDVKNGVKRTPKASTPPHPMHGKKTKRGKRT